MTDRPNEIGRTATVDNLNHLRVTARGYEDIFQSVNISDDAIRQLPPNARVLDIGSGIYQELAQHIQSVRKDVFVTSLDPTLAMYETPEGDMKLLTNGDKKYIAVADSDPLEINYHQKNDGEKYYSFQQLLDGQKMHHDRISAASQHGGLAAIAPEFPIQSESMDMVIDSFGPATWYCCDTEKTLEYFTQIARMLKKGGSIYIFPIESVNEYWNALGNEYKKRFVKTRDRVLPVFQKLGLLSTEFVRDITFNNGKKTKRLGMKITKQ